MEYLVLGIALFLFFGCVFVKEALYAKRKEKQFVDWLYQNYGQLPEREFSQERYSRVGSYFERHRQEGQIDDITWNDLNMDAFFRQINYTFSASGEEYLYYTLRNVTNTKEELEHLEEVVDFFMQHPHERVKTQLLMRDLGFTGKFSLYDYLENLDYLGERNSRKEWFLNFLFVPLFGLMFFNMPLALLGLAVLIVYNITSYFKEKKVIEPYIISFNYVMRLMKMSGKLCKLDMPACREHQQIIVKHNKELQAVTAGSFWVFWQTSGNILDVVIDYVRMIFHVDIIIFNRMLAHVRAHTADIDAIIGQVGYLEMAVAVGAMRTSMEEGYCVPVFEKGDDMRLVNVYHPLLKSPVKNSIHVKKGILLTGSNASGKSTFLRTVALNAIMAQTLHTCAADEYVAPLYRIYSSMSLKDDIGSGESYYIVEIKALKRILDAAALGERRVLCFVDEVLRGTNTVERIAASTQILKSLTGMNLLCFAATHDIELTGLLENEFDNYHFEEEIRDGDIFFHYKLLDGRATTRNAIKLLEIMGYAPEIIDSAQKMAGDFLATGQWKA